MKTVAIAGASGYAGAELIRLIHTHPEFQLKTISAGSNAGSKLAEVHPQFAAIQELADLKFVETTVENLKADLIFFALPHGQSAEIISQLPDNQPVVDLGADFRLREISQWEKYYGGSHAGHFVYGLPELGQRAQIKSSTRVANPGCYATAIALGLAPIIKSTGTKLHDIIVVAASGTSGAGRNAKVNLLGSEVMGSMSPYKVGGTHQHTPEIEQMVRDFASGAVEINFTPMLAPMPRGILATISVLTGDSEETLRAALLDQYRDETFVQVLPAGQLPSTASTLGSNAVHIQVAKDDRLNRATIFVALDNLVKGAAGQAVQNANLIFGFDEAAGLSAIGVAP